MALSGVASSKLTAYLTQIAKVSSLRIGVATTALAIVCLALWIIRLKQRLSRQTSELKSLSHFRQIADNLPIVLALSNADLSQFLYVNCAYQTLWGRTVESVYENSMSFVDGVHPEDRQYLAQELQRLKKGEPIKELECRVVRPDGSTSWVLCRGFPIFDDGGRIVRLVGSAQDVSERKRAENRIRESEDLYRDLVEHSQDLICTHDLQGILLSVNEAPLRILGYSREELLNKPLRDFVASEARPLCDAYLSKIQIEGFARGVLPVVTKNGTVRLWEYSNSLRSDGVNAPIVRGIAHDVTEQKRAEEALRKSEEKFSKAFQSSPVEMVITTLNEGRFVDVNENFSRCIGYGRDEVIGRTSLGLGLWADPGERSAMVEEIRKSGRVSNREIRIRAKSGEFGIKLYSAEPLTIDGEQCLLAVSVDVTARRRAEEDLRKLSGQLLRLHDEERRRLARELHDTTGQNLVAVAGLLGQMQLSISTSNRAFAKLVSKCDELTSHCIREVRTLSYLLFPPLLEGAGLESAIQDYLTGFSERTGIRAELRVSPNLARMSREIELALFRIVQECLVNIQRHSGSQTAQITIEHGLGAVQLEVTDSGRGIPGFEQKRAGDISSASGVGIRSMVERAKQIGGRLEIESSRVGTTIRVQVPDHRSLPQDDSRLIG
jgi:PAS domain S-box-containing protein